MNRCFIAVLATMLALISPLQITVSAEEVTEGSKAPDFDLVATGGQKISLAGLQGKNVVLYFYPKDDTPGCTKEAKAFEDSRAEFTAVNTIILGVSLDSLESHDEFAEKCGLGFPLLSDPQGTVISAYGCWRSPNLFKGSALNVNRSTFLIDSTGVIRKIWRSVSVSGHAQEVLAEARKLADGQPGSAPQPSQVPNTTDAQ